MCRYFENYILKKGSDYPNVINNALTFNFKKMNVGIFDHKNKNKIYLTLDYEIIKSNGYGGGMRVGVGSVEDRGLMTSYPSVGVNISHIVSTSRKHSEIYEAIR